MPSQLPPMPLLTSWAFVTPVDARDSQRVLALYAEHQRKIHRHTHKLFAGLLLFQWLAAIAVAVWITPLTWVGELSHIHIHVWAALGLGGTLVSLPLMSVLVWPEHALTRHTVAIAQVSFSALLIHLTGGRIETHFHVFGSLAVLSFYRDWRVLLTASGVVAIDHFVRGLVWPASVYGEFTVEMWRWLEHAGWVLFEDFFLILSIGESHREMQHIAIRQAESESTNRRIEQTVIERTSALRESEERYELAIRGTSEGIWDWKIDIDHVTLSPRCIELLGETPTGPATEENIFLSRLHDDDRERVEAAIQAHLERRVPFDVEFRLLTGNRGYRWFRARGQALWDESGRPTRMAGSASDIHDRKLTEESLRQKDDQLRHAQKLNSLGTLAGGVAHEFNNLLQAIRGYTEFVVDSLPPGDERRNDLEQVLHAAERAATMTRQMLGFGRRQMLNPVPSDPNQLVRDACRLLRPLIGEHIELNLSLTSEPGIVLVDTGEFQNMLLNLCINGRDAMPNGGNLVVTTEYVTFSPEYCELHTDIVAGRYLKLCVTDTGCGMPPEIRDRIFEPFFTTKELGKGTGLGLSMVYGLVQQHQGAIHVYSEPGCGTAFKIYLPVHAGTNQSADVAAPLALSCGNELILVAEDDPLVRDVTVRILQRAGYRTVTATNGEEAVTVFVAHIHEVRLALLDIVMPKVGGHEAGQRIRKLRPDTRLLFCSGYDPETAQAKQLTDVGIQVVTKPLDPAVLLTEIRRLLDAPTLGA